MLKPAAPYATLLIAVVAIGGCAGVPRDLGRSGVDSLVSERGQLVNEGSGASLSTLVEQPLTSLNVVRIALMNNPELQATYASLGYGAADIYEAGRISNPVFSGAFLDSNETGMRDQMTFGLAASFTDLITLGARKRLSLGAFAALKQSVGAEVLHTAAQAERAYYRYVCAKQVATLREQVAKAGALSAALAERFHSAGNLTMRELALQRAAASEARLEYLEAQASALEARTELATVLGLSTGDVWEAPAQLHVPLQREDELGTLLALASNSRLDLAAARTQADVLADRVGVVNWTRWLGDLDVGVERERETDGTKLIGPAIDWEVPIFNQHRDALLRADADLQVAIAEVRRLSTAVDNEVRLAHARVENAHARVLEYRDVLIPQRIESVARGQEEVNFMLIGIFELISLKQEEYDTYQGYLEAIRDYWLARTELSLASGAALPSSAHIDDKKIDIEEFVRPQSGGMDHSGHGSMQNRFDRQTTEADEHKGHSMQTPVNNDEHKDHDGGSL